MIYEFRSRATGSIVMMEKVAERMLGILGKPAGPQGIITVDQLPAAIACLRAAIADERHAREAAREAAHASAQATDALPAPAAGGGHDAEEAGPGTAIPLEARAQPLIEMFERALAGKRDVTWGV
jgi:hypothetical protein